MFTIGLVFLIVVAVVVMIRRSRQRGSSPSIVAALGGSPSPPTAAEWEKRLIGDLLDKKRREDAEAKLLSELAVIAGPAAAETSPAAATSPVAKPGLA